MSDPKAHVGVFVDFDSLARFASAAGEAAPAAETWNAGDLAVAIVRYAGGVGRIDVARAYADWSRRGDEVSAVQAARLVPVLCPTGPAGEDRAPFRLAVDALAALYAGGVPDAFVLATADGRLLPLVHALRADGADVLLLMPSAATADDLKAEADVCATLAEVLGGAVGRPSEPRGAVEDEAPPPPAPTVPAPPPAPSGSAVAARPARGPARSGFEDAPRRSFDAPLRGADAPRRGFDAPPRGFEGPRRAFEGAPRGFEGPPARRAFDAPRGFDGASRGGPERGPRGYDPESLDLSNYDWSPFVRLIDELEHRLPFVGVRYLVNKVLGPRNCGIDDPRRKRDLINRAVEEGLISMFEVGNLEGRGDPVTACRLDRRSAAVVAVLGGETPTPNVAEARDEFTPVDDDPEAVEPDAEDPRSDD